MYINVIIPDTDIVKYIIISQAIIQEKNQGYIWIYSFLLMLIVFVIIQTTI